MGGVRRFIARHAFRHLYGEYRWGPGEHVGETVTTPPEPRPYVVVLLTGSACAEYAGAICVMQALGPYTREEAEDEFRRAPRWTMPHVIMLEDWRSDLGRIAVDNLGQNT